MAVEDWMPTLASKLGEITGLTGTGAGGVRYYADMPGALAEFPIMVITVLNGRDSWGASQGSICVHQVQMTLYNPSPLLPEVHSVLVPFIALVRNKLAANTALGGLVQDIGPSEEAPFYQGPGRVTYTQSDGKENEFAGIIFRIQVKDHDTLTVSAG